jgi:hypothetical protein
MRFLQGKLNTLEAELKRVFVELLPEDLLGFFGRKIMDVVLATGRDEINLIAFVPMLEPMLLVVHSRGVVLDFRILLMGHAG